MRADLDLVNRRGTGWWQTSETNRIWNQAGLTGAGSVGGYRNGRAQAVTDISTSSALSRRHRSLHSTLTFTPGTVVVTLAHVHSRTETPPPSSVGIPAGLAIASDDPGRHFVYGQAVADVLGYLSVGALYSYAQGATIRRQFEHLRQLRRLSGRAGA